MTPWISVCEALPPVGSAVLVRGRKDAFDGSQTQCVARLFYDGDVEMWELEGGEILGETVIEWTVSAPLSSMKS